MRRGLAALALLAACGARTEIAAPSAADTSGDASVEVPCVASELPVYGVEGFTVDERDVAYFADRNKLVRWDGQEKKVLVELDPSEPIAGVAVDSSRAYYMLYSGSLRAMPRDGGPSVTLASDPRGGDGFQPLPDGSILLFRGDMASSHILRLAPDGTISTIWEGADGAGAGAVDGATLYLVNYTATSARILRIDLGSGASSTLVDGLVEVTSLAVLGTRLYFAQYGAQQGIYAVPKTGGAVSSVYAPTTTFVSFIELATDATTLYATVASGPFSPPGTWLYRFSADGVPAELASVSTPDEMFAAPVVGPRAVHWLDWMTRNSSARLRELCK